VTIFCAAAREYLELYPEVSANLLLLDRPSAWWRRAMDIAFGSATLSDSP
jgi:hypothetical protein